MARRILLGVVILFAALIFLIFILFVALAVWSTSIASGVTLPNGLAVNASARSIYLGIETSGNTATIRTMRAKVVVEPTKFTIDDQFIGPIPPGAKAVDVNIDGSKVNITADGVPVTPSGP
jgi:hypothetical protein